MQNTSGSGGIQDAKGKSELEEDVRNSIAAGGNVQEEVRDLTVKALSKQKRDTESLRHVIASVLKGVDEGMQQKIQQTSASGQTIMEPVREAVAGLDWPWRTWRQPRNWLLRKQQVGPKSSPMRISGAFERIWKVWKLCFWIHWRDRRQPLRI